MFIWVNENTREVWNGHFSMLSGLTSSEQLMSHYSENIEKKYDYGQKISQSNVRVWKDNERHRNKKLKHTK